MVSNFNKYVFSFYLMFLSMFCVVKVYAADYTINAGTTETNVVGSWENTLKIYGTSQNALINGGDGHSIFSKGLAEQTQIDNYGKLTVYSGGKAVKTTLNLGNLYVRYNGTIESTDVNGGWLDVYDGGIALDTRVNNNGNFYAQDGSYIKNITINSGGGFNGYSGAKVEGLILNEGAKFNLVTDMSITGSSQYGNEIFIKNNIANGFIIGDASQLGVVSGTTARNIIVDNGGLIYGEANSNINDVVINSGGSFNFNTDMTITNSSMYGQDFSILNKTANNLLINSGGNFTVLDGGTINNTVVNNGGVLTVASGGKGSDLTINNGFVDVLSGGKVQNTTLNSGSVKVQTNGLVDNIYINSGVLEARTGAFVDNATIVSGELNLYGGNAENVVHYSGNLRLADGGVLSNSVVKGGWFDIYTGSVANSMVVDGGEMYVQNGALANKTSINSGLIQVLSGGKVNGTNVFDGTLKISSGATASLTNIKGGNTVVENGGLIKNSVVQSGVLDILSGDVGGIADKTVVTGGTFNVFGTALNTEVNTGGTIVANSGSFLNNLTANAGAILSLASGTNVAGNFMINNDTDTSGSTYNFSDMFSSANLDVKSLTVLGGVNNAFNNRLVNYDFSQDKNLTLADGEYSIASVIKEGSTQVAGWDVINIKASESAPSTIVKLESDIELVGSNKEVNIGENAVLDVSGHSPLEITIDGSVTNQGTMDFTIYDNDGEADDVVTIVGDYKASPGALIVLNIEPEKDKADKLVIQGDVIGNTNVFLKSNSEASTEAEILFAEVANDNEATASSFDIWRVEGSPFVWKSKKEENNWYTYIDGLPVEPERPTDTSGVRKVVPEMIAYMGLYEAGFEQTSGLSRVVSDQVAKNQLIGRGCRNRVCREIEPVRSAWVSPVNQNIDVKAPYKYEAKINGLDAGIDIGSDGINKWGVLASYRKGDYEFDGEGEKYYSEKGSEIDIDSYGMGLYFRRDKYNTKFAGMVYAGLQKAEISSDDGVKANTDALEIGASLDVSHIYEVVKDLTIAPELQISYQMLDYDNIKDNAGKKVQLEASHRFTIEAGAKVEKKWKLDEGKASIYVKPSIVQTVHGGGKLNVAGLEGIHTSEDRTLGRFEIGGEYEVNTRWSVGATAAHTFGADYKDTTFSLDAKYRF